MEKADAALLLLVGDGFALDDERELGGGTGSDSYVAVIVRASADRPSSRASEKLRDVLTMRLRGRFRALQTLEKRKHDDSIRQSAVRNKTKGIRRAQKRW